MEAWSLVEGNRCNSVIKCYMCCELNRYKIAWSVWEIPYSSVYLECRDYGVGSICVCG